MSSLVFWCFLRWFLRMERIREDRRSPCWVNICVPNVWGCLDTWTFSYWPRKGRREITEITEKTPKFPFCFQQSSPGRLRKPGGSVCDSPSTMTRPAVLRLAVIAAVLGCGENEDLMQIVSTRRPMEAILSKNGLLCHMTRPRNTHPGFSGSLKDFGAVLLTGSNIFMGYNSAGVSLFLAGVEQKLPLMWSFHNPPSFIHQGMNTHAKTDSNQNSGFFFFVSLFCVLMICSQKSRGCLAGGERCSKCGLPAVNEELNKTGLCSSALSLECYSCAAESPDNCKSRQRCSGNGDSCLRLTSNGKGLVKYSGFSHGGLGDALKHFHWSHDLAPRPDPLPQQNLWHVLRVSALVSLFSSLVPKGNTLAECVSERRVCPVMDRPPVRGGFLPLASFRRMDGRVHSFLCDRTQKKWLLAAVFSPVLADAAGAE